MSSLARFLRQHWGKLPRARAVNRELIGVLPGVKRTNRPAGGDEQGSQKRQNTKVEEEFLAFDDLHDDVLALLTQWLSMKDVMNLELASGAFRSAMAARRTMLGQRFRLHITAATFERARAHQWLHFLVKISTDTWWVLQRLAQLGPLVSDVVFTPVSGDRFALREIMPHPGAEGASGTEGAFGAAWQLQKLTLDFTDVHFNLVNYTLDFEGAVFSSITELHVFANQNDDVEQDMLPDGNQYITEENFPSLRHLTIWNAGLDFGSIRWLPRMLETAKLWVSIVDVGEFSKATHLTRLHELTLHIFLDGAPQPLDTLKTLVGLRVLELGGFSIPNDWYSKLPDALVSLTIAHEAAVQDGDLFVAPEAASMLPRTLRDLRIYTDAWMTSVEQLPLGLTRLELLSARFGEALDTLPASLKHVVILGRNGMDHVIDCALLPALETVELMTQRGRVERVRSAPALRSITVGRNQITF